MAKNILLGSIGAMTFIFSWLYFGSANYLCAALSLAAGVIWIALEIKWNRSFASIFFLVFFALAIVASLSDLPTPLILLGLSANLAAWDLSRLEARIAKGAEGDVRATLEIKHLQKLAVVMAVGFIVALLASSAQISLSFVVLAVITLLVMIALRVSMLYARKEER